VGDDLLGGRVSNWEGVSKNRIHKGPIDVKLGRRRHSQKSKKKEKKSDQKRKRRK
jgi:hypothetical protein